MTPLETARAFIDAVQEKQADVAADLCADDVEIVLPGADSPLRGKEGVRQMVRMAPKLEQSFRSEEELDGMVRVTTLTRAPGIFANYTTWVFAFQDGRVARLTFELRAAN
ncbi:MAG: nuclear transport factor 2 family protein [Chloroflexi bacterium]|nr:nuclear transport factor 2 family protein [Chloroflexota bacterium]